MKFVSDEHEQFYNDHADIAGSSPDFSALVYTLGINASCREHFGRLYDTQSRCIIPAGLFEGWQTGASKRITRLAFNLFTWQTAEGDEPEKYTPKELFSSLDEQNRQGALLALTYFA